MVVRVTFIRKSDTAARELARENGQDPLVAVEYDPPPSEEYSTAVLVPAGILSLHPTAQYAVSMMLLRSIAGLIQVPVSTKFGVTTNVGVATNAGEVMAVVGTVKVIVSAADMEKAEEAENVTVAIVSEVRTTSVTAKSDRRLFQPLVSEDAETKPSIMFCLWALKVEPSATHLVLVRVTIAVWPPACISGDVVPSETVPVIAADSVPAVMVIVGVAVNAGPPMAEAGTVTVIVSLVAML